MRQIWQKRQDFLQRQESLTGVAYLITKMYQNEAFGCTAAKVDVVWLAKAKGDVRIYDTNKNSVSQCLAWELTMQSFSGSSFGEWCDTELNSDPANEFPVSYF